MTLTRLSGFLLSLLLGAALLCAGAAAGPLQDRLAERAGKRHAGEAAGTGAVRIEVGGVARSYLLHVPKAEGPLPVVMSLHGFRSDAGQQQTLSGLSRLADAEGFIAVYPQGLDAKWRFARPGADADFILAVIEDVALRTAVDRDRIYVNGISNGAQMAWRMACDHPQVFAAVGYVAGGYPKVCNAGQVPTILFHGTDDRLLPYDGRPPFIAVRDFARGAATGAECRLAETGEIVFATRDVTGERWACNQAAPVVLYTVQGGGHSWPGSAAMPAQITTQDIDASQLMWAFFKGFSR